MTDTTNLAGDLRQALEGTTPGPWEWVEDGEPMWPESSMWLENGDGTDVIRGGLYEWLHMTQADGELIAAAPDLLARAADRIELLEAIVTEIGRSFDGVDGLCQVCGSWVGRGFNYANKHADSCEVLAAINISKGGA